MKKKFLKVFFSLVAIGGLVFVFSLIFPVKSLEKSIEIKNIQIENIGTSGYIEQPYDEIELFIDYVYNDIRSGISYKEYKELYLNNSNYVNYQISFELTNNSDSFLGLFHIDSYDVDGVIVENTLNNEEVVFIQPGETDIIGISVYVDSAKFPSVTDDFVLNQISCLQFSKLKKSGNLDIIIHSIVDSFYKNYVKLER